MNVLERFIESITHRRERADSIARAAHATVAIEAAIRGELVLCKEMWQRVGTVQMLNESLGRKIEVAY